MKLAEALLLRADLQRKITQLTSRITPVLIVRRNNKPQEDPIKLLAQLRESVTKLQGIIVKINRTNVATQLADGRTLMEGLAQRDALKTLQTHLRTIRQAATIHGSSYSDMETTVSIKNLQIEIEQTGRSFREIDSQIQGLNWTTELLE
ncbi:DIP1984 family protein [Neolewinella persica]|uniref:DIP1984 family protein n=1 Tax=Neolewinella persica TaxID=70998 RepID=UPI000369F89D|nr:DIP1984 family protein [Neolewinella persica]